MDKRPIGIFDSGSGGLTVVAEVKKQLPDESVIYYGDLARVPYGSKSKEEIIAINAEIITYLISRKVKMIIVACNTSSALSLEEDKDKFSIPIIGLIGPGAQSAAIITKNKKVGIIATEATVRSHAYKKLLLSLNPSIEVYEQACPKFVPLIESGKTNSADLKSAVTEYIQPLLLKDIDTLIHGCTHYPLIEDKLRKISGKNIEFVNPAVGTVALAKEILEKNNIFSKGPAVYEYIATKIDERGNYVRIDGRGQFFGGPSAPEK